MDQPERCGKCGAEPGERKGCPRCGKAEWVLQHGAHYMQGSREVIGCNCPSSHSALGRRKEAIAERQAARVKAGKRADWNCPVTTPAMAKKAAEGLAQRLSPTQALRRRAIRQRPLTVRAQESTR